MLRWARPGAAIFPCLLAGCLSGCVGIPADSEPTAPTNVLPDLWRGNLPLSSKKLNSVPTLERSDSLRQPQPETLLILAQRCYETAGDATKDPEQRYEHYQRALQLYRSVLRQDPNNEQAILSQARIYKKQGQTYLALAELQRLVARSPKNSAAWYELGMCHGACRNWAEQVRCLQQACQLEPENTRYAVHLGLALARAERWQEAEQQLLRSVGPGRGHYYLALMAEHLGRHDLLASFAQRAVQADPSLREQASFQRWLAGSSATPSTAR
ncbi:MAG: tetratricopeptide repeat protein [Gemmatales bacterium]|nr:tetratricopeptide repeat protein [Gemmatales bacterium]MDW7995003.1 tetratricopeptide repeat protein [Gemmatales bacterium]